MLKLPRLSRGRLLRLLALLALLPLLLLSLVPVFSVAAIAGPGYLLAALAFAALVASWFLLRRRSAGAPAGGEGVDRYSVRESL